MLFLQGNAMIAHNIKKHHFFVLLINQKGERRHSLSNMHMECNNAFVKIRFFEQFWTTFDQLILILDHLKPIFHKFKLVKFNPKLLENNPFLVNKNIRILLKNIKIE
jgi:hypothetical protein